MPKQKMLAAQMRILSILPETNLPMYCLLVVSLVRGMSANGSKKARDEFTMSIISSMAFASKATATATQGTTATQRVTMALAHLGRLMSRKPSMTNCPAYVVVMQLLWAAAIRAIPHSTLPPLRVIKSGKLAILLRRMRENEREIVFVVVGEQVSNLNLNLNLRG